MNRLRRFFALLAPRLDGLAVTALAGLMAWLVLAGNYWMYLNPRFKPVTLAASGLLCLFGLYALWRPVSRPSLGRGLAFAALLAMALFAEVGTQAISLATDSDPFAACPVPSQATANLPPVPSRLRAGGRDYIPINAGELYDIAAKARDERFAKPYAMRGIVHRAPELDAKGEFVLFRLAIWCCFADGTAVGFRVRLAPGTAPPEDKGWLVVFGHLAEAPEGDRKEYTLPGMPFSSIAPSALFAADQFEAATPQPEEIPMFEWRQEEPYAY